MAIPCSCPLFCCRARKILSIRKAMALGIAEMETAGSGVGPVGVGGLCKNECLKDEAHPFRERDRQRVLVLAEKGAYDARWSRDGKSGKRKRWASVMIREITRVAAGVMLLGGLVVSSIGQSGRGLPKAPPPRPQPVPRNPVNGPVVLGIPEGGKLVRQEATGGTGRYILRNELTAVIRERHAVPLVAVEVVVKGGWADEPAAWRGVAALTQELLRMEVEGGPVLEEEVARLGGRLSGEVNARESRLRVVAPAESYARVVELLAGMVRKRDFSGEQLTRAARLVDLRATTAGVEIERVAVDRLQGLGGRRGQMGSTGSLAASGQAGRLTVEQVREFYERFYHPANMVVAVVGDLFSLPALGQIQLQFGGLTAIKNGPAGQSAAPGPTGPTGTPGPAAKTESRTGEMVAPGSAGLRYQHSQAPIQQSVVTFGYRLPVDESLAPAARLKERATIEVLTAVLGLGRASRLAQGLREGASSRDRISVVTGARAIFLAGSLKNRPNGPPNDDEGGGWLVAQLTVDPVRIDRAEAEYFREIERLRREVISEAELQRAITLLEKRHFDELETVEGEAARLATSQLLDGDYRFFDSANQRRRRVTAGEVQAAAARYLVIEQLVVDEVEPLTAAARTFTAASFSDLVVTFAPGAARAVRMEEVKPATELRRFVQGEERVLPVDEQNVIVAPIPLPVRDFSVLRGPRAYVREDKSRPVVTVTIVFQGGRLQETNQPSGQNAGITELMLRSMLKSTTTRKADLIAHELESYGAEVQVVNEPDFYGFTIEVLSRNTEAAVKVLLEVIENPFFGPEEVARERGLLLAELQGARDQLPRENDEQFLGSIFPGHPYALPRLGLTEAISRLTPERLEEWHNRSIRRQYPFVFLVGDTDGSSMVSRIFSDGLKRGDLDKTLKVNLPTQFPPARDVVRDSGWPVSWQSVGFRIGSQALAGPGDYLAGAMLAELVSSGPLGTELRSRQAIAVGTTARLTQQLAGSCFSVRVITPPEKETVALDLLNREFQRLAGNVPSDEEFELGRNAAIGRYAILLQSHAARTLEYARAALIGRRPADVDGQPEAMITVRKTDLKRVAENLFRNNSSGRGILRGQSGEQK
jgi:zinc protease